MTDGPFSEAKEQLAGVWAIDCESIERAIEVAAPVAEYDTVDVRPLTWRALTPISLPAARPGIRVDMPARVSERSAGMKTRRSRLLGSNDALKGRRFPHCTSIQAPPMRIAAAWQ